MTGEALWNHASLRHQQLQAKAPQHEAHTSQLKHHDCSDRLSELCNIIRSSVYHVNTFIMLIMLFTLIFQCGNWTRILVQVTIYRRQLIGRDGHPDQSAAYDIS